MIARQHVWLGPEATSFAAPCEACLATRESLAVRHSVVEGRLRADADVGFCTCPRGHRLVLRRIGRSLAATG